MSDKRHNRFYLTPMSREELDFNHAHCRHYDPETPCCYCGLVDLEEGVPSDDPE
jgi:hypothetical protein